MKTQLLREQKAKCRFCNVQMMDRWEQYKRNYDIVKVSGDLFGVRLEMLVHERCWNKLKIPDDNWENV